MRRLTVLLTAMVAALVVVSGGALSQTAPVSTGQAQDIGKLEGVHTQPTDINDSGEVVGYSAFPFLYSGGQMKDLNALIPADTGWTLGNAQAINTSGDIAGNGILIGGTIRGRAFLATSNPTNTPQYSIKDLGTLGGDYSQAFALNDSGQVVGNSNHSSGSGLSTAFLYSESTGEMEDLGTLGGNSSLATDINDSGQVVGYSSTSGPFGETHAFLYSNGHMQDLGTLGGNDIRNDIRASGINNSGQIVGSWSPNADEQHAFLYSDGRMKDLGTLPGGNFARATDINDSGKVVGYSNTSSRGSRPFVYSESTGQMQELDLGTLGSTFSEATAINNFGQIVGQSGGSAFLYSESGDTTQPQLNLPNSLSQTATSPNGATVSYTATATDDVDGDLPVDCSPASGSTFPLGITTVNCSAEDAAGNVASGSFEVRVVFDFGNGSGGSFGQPIRDTELNQLAAGAAVPVKFGLGADYGLNIFAEGYPKSTPIDCPGLPTAVVGETSTVSKSGLTYDAASGLYTYVWKTDRAWKGTCRALNVKLADGTDHLVKFEFK